MQDRGLSPGDISEIWNVRQPEEVAAVYLSFYEEVYEAFREQAMALAEGGADALCFRTMSDLEEIKIAIRAACGRSQLRPGDGGDGWADGPDEGI